MSTVSRNRSLLIGSRALAYWLPPKRRPGDWDIVITSEGFASWQEQHRDRITSIKRYRNKAIVAIVTPTVPAVLEITLDDHLLLACCPTGQEISYHGLTMDIAGPTLLYCLKKSHLTKPIKWFQHMSDYRRLSSYIKRHGLEPNSSELDVYQQRRYHGKARSLNMKNDDFFAASAKMVRRDYEHDDLHRATCYYDRPLFERLKRDHSKARIERDLFEMLPEQDKLRTIREEAYAIALERYLIPGEVAETGETAGITSGARSPLRAYRMALKKICTTLTGGWFRDFAIESYHMISCPDVDYYGKFRDWRLRHVNA